MKESSPSQKKILENPFLGSLIVPIAIVLVGALIIFGVTKMLSSERSYRDLVDELQSKTFGNKWVAAYELSKQINSSQIPSGEYPWLIQNLSDAYKNSIDPRTKGFIVAALGALKDNRALPLFQISISDPDIDVKFHTVVSLANMPKGINFNWKPVLDIFNLSGDEFSSLKQAAILALATHHVEEAHSAILLLLSDSNPLIKYSAAIGLINFKDEQAVATLTYILQMNYPESGVKISPPALDAQQIAELKLSILIALEKNHWNKLNNIILELANKDANTTLIGKAKEVLNLLKN